MRNIFLFSLCLFTLPGCADYNSPKLTQFEITEETVLDKNTKLMWANNDNKNNLNRQEALDYCNSYSGGGFNDWRMPTISELQGLIQSKVEGKGKVLTLSSSLVWASETDDSKGAFCNFKSQGCSWMEQVISISLRALPVRDTEAQDEFIADSTVPEATFTPITRPQTVEQRLQVLDMLRKQELITTDEYNQKKRAILDEL